MISLRIECRLLTFSQPAPLQYLLTQVYLFDWKKVHKYGRFFVTNLFFINSFFEEELTNSASSIENYLCKHPVYLQLHYLSCIISDEEQVPLLAFAPEEGYLDKMAEEGLLCSSPVFLTDSLSGNNILSSWGASLLLADWAQAKRCSYPMPSFEVVKQVNGKDFSFESAPKLPGAELIESEKELLLWYQKTKGPRVVKTLYGSSGRGHCILYKENEEGVLYDFFRRHKPSSTAFLVEPWVERVLDFSSQWFLTKDGKVIYFGVTVCRNSPRGIYRESLVGPEDLLFKGYEDFLSEHRAQAKKALMQMHEKGFFGPVGIDAMLYKDPNSKKILLHPIVEINARMTMGRVALKLYSKLKRQELVGFGYEPKKKEGKNLLPESVEIVRAQRISLPGRLFIRELQLR